MKKNPVSITVFFFIAAAFSHCAIENPENKSNNQLSEEVGARRGGGNLSNAGSDITITLPTDSITLDGSQSREPGGIITSYLWTKVLGPSSCSIIDPSNQTTLVTNLVEGIYTFRLTVYGTKNRSSSNDISVTVQSVQSVDQPSISAISPSSGKAGTSVVINGSNFDASPSVSFNGTPAAIISSSDMGITTAVPEGASSGAISITSNGSTVSSTTSFTVLPAAPTGIFFQGNMDNVTISTYNSNLVFKGWDDLKSNSNVEDFVINDIGGIQYANQEIDPDPTDASKNVMLATVLNDDPNVSGTTRAQMTLHFKDGTDLPIYHTSHRMFLNPDISYLENYSSSINWFELFEIWNRHEDAWDGDEAGSCRWNLSLFKNEGTGQPLYWVVKGEYMQPANVAYQYLWRYNNKQVPIPFGKWFTLDLYMKRGEGTDGRMTITITVDGEQPQVLFDVANTTIYPGHPEIQLKAWQPFKLYLNDTYLDWMSTNGKGISAYYNDFIWYEN